MSGTIFFVLTIFITMFSGILIMYGLGVPSIVTALQAPINCDINGLPQTTCSFPAWRPPNIGNYTASGTSSAQPWWICWTFLPSCWAGGVTAITNTGNAIWNGLQLVAYAMAWFAIATSVFFNKCFQGIYLIFGLVQIISTDFGIPFLFYFFLGFIVFYIMYGISMLKPGGSGLPG